MSQQDRINAPKKPLRSKPAPRVVVILLTRAVVFAIGWTLLWLIIGYLLGTGSCEHDYNFRSTDYTNVNDRPLDLFIGNKSIPDRFISDNNIRGNSTMNDYDSTFDRYLELSDFQAPPSGYDVRQAQAKPQPEVIE